MKRKPTNYKRKTFFALEIPRIERIVTLDNRANVKASLYRSKKFSINKYRNWKQKCQL